MPLIDPSAPGARAYRPARKVKAKRKPTHANVYVPPASLSSPEARRAAREAKHPRKANVYVPPRELADPRQRAATRYNVRVHKGEAAGPAAPPRYGIERRKREAAKREAERHQKYLDSLDLYGIERYRKAQASGTLDDLRRELKDLERPKRAEHERPKLPKTVASAGPGSLVGKYLDTVLHGDYGGMGVVKGAAGVAERTGKDAAEMAVTLPSSVVHLAETAVTHPKKLPGELAAPYVALYHDPIKTLSEHPLQTALMVAPGVRAPGLTAGRVARLTGRQSLRRADATLPGTSLRARRTGSRDYFVRKAQERQDAAEPPRISTTPTRRKPVPELHRRVDEFHDRGQQHRAAAQAAAGRQANERFGDMPDKAERDAAIEEHMGGTAKRASEHVRREFAREFGSTWRVGQGGAIVKPKHPPEHSGVIHATRADAERVTAAIERAGHFEPAIIELEGATPGVTSGFAVVPAQAAQRLAQHGNVGHAGWAVGPGLRVTSRAFRKTVLPTSTKWLGGQVVEGAVRSATHGGGPIPVVRYVRGRRFLKAYEREHGKAAADDLLARTISSQQFGVTGPAAEFARHGPTVAGEFADSGVSPHAQLVTELAAKPGVRHLRAGYRWYAEKVFNDINGPIERFYKTGMLGKEVKRAPVMERRLIGLSADAMAEAAQGLRGTAAQVELGRALDAAYGKYTKHGPTMRDTILHTTPFIPWFLNMGRFLTRTLPREHPVRAALLADVNQAELEWRKQHRLSYYGDHVPGWLMGSYPARGGGYAPAGRFMPFLPGEWTGAAAGQVYPQLFGILENLAGFNFKGQKIEGEGAKAANALLTAAESMIPGVAPLGRVTGLSGRYVRGEDKPSVIQGKSIPRGVVDLVNPVRPTAAPRSRRRKPKAASLPGWSGGGGGGGIPGWG